MQQNMDKIQMESRREIEDLMLALDEAIPKTSEERSRELLKSLQEKLYAMYIAW